MSFEAHSDGGWCPKCNRKILRGDIVQFDSRGEGLEHVECGQDDQSDQKVIDWGIHIHQLEQNRNVLEFDAEPAFVVPLQRPTCPRCFLELPVSMVCGSC